MKKIISTISLLLAILTALPVSAYKVTVKWNLAEGAEIRLGAINSAPESLSPGQTSYTLERDTYTWLYVIAKPGYRISEVTGPVEGLKPSISASVQNSSGSYWGKSMSEGSLSSWGADPVVNVTLEKIERTSSFTIDVENGASYIAASFTSDNYTVPLVNGSNEVRFDPGFDTGFQLAGDGVESFYSVTLNGTPVEKNKWRATYDLSAAKAGDKIRVRVFEGDEPVYDQCEITLNLPEDIAGSLFSIRNWTLGRFVEMTDGKLTVNEGTDIAFNFDTEDYTFTSFTYAGKDITPDFNESTGVLRFTVNESGVLAVTGSTRDYGTVEFKAYVMNPEGVILYTGGYGQDPADLTTGGETIASDIALKDATLDAASSRLYTLPVSGRTGAVYVAPKEGWYIETVQALVTNDQTGKSEYMRIPYAQKDDGSTVFYVIAKRLDKTGKVVFNVLGNETSLILKGNTTVSNNWGNPSQAFTLEEGEQTVSYTEGFDNPFNLRPLVSMANFAVYLDVLALTKDEESGSYSIEPFHSDTDPELMSTVTVYNNGQRASVRTVKYTATGLTAQLYYSPVRHEAASGTKLLAGTQIFLRPSTEACEIRMGDEVVHGYREDGAFVDGLNAQGEYVTTVPEGTTTLTFTVSPANPSGISSPDAADGETPGATIVTIDGRVLYRNVPAGEKPSLEPGLYIVNGQKVMIGRRK